MHTAWDTSNTPVFLKLWFLRVEKKENFAITAIYCLFPKKDVIADIKESTLTEEERDIELEPATEARMESCDNGDGILKKKKRHSKIH